MGDMQQKDLVLDPSQYAYVLDKTKGNISCWVGPCKTSLSTSDSLVRFNERTKKFESCNYDDAINSFACVPENWYAILKNPVEGDKYPAAGTANTTPEKMLIGRKVNICGPTSFALYPGQMAKVIRGHALRSNQYLLARVYEAKSASASDGEVLDSEGNKIETKTNYVNGQILVIKGTEVSFYIPPTGIEVIPVDNDARNGYVREAVTLERLEYCILKDEDGNKRYVHGPEVVFPKPTETFVASASGSYIFRAIELSKISGIYAKVIAEYTDEKGVLHPVGEELFITGEDQMIYYPRPEHAIINYDNKIMHHAIAIPEGEGRYIMNRLTGEIATKRGPAMYLPDPRTEVVVKRKLTPTQCELWYPGNTEAQIYNHELTEKSVEKSLRTINTDSLYAFQTVSNSVSTLANLEAKANISRGTSYTKPRTITLDNKYEGVVSIDVWTGYAVNVISKDGSRKVVRGPQTILLDYDQTLEVLLMSTGKPKNSDRAMSTVFLRHENNKVSDIINVETKDFVTAEVRVSYCVDFDEEAQSKWFNVENYVQYLCDRQRSLIKRAAKKYTIEEFYQNYADIVRNVAIDADKERGEGAKVGRYFSENGMRVYDCEVLSIKVERSISDLLEEHQFEMVQKALDLTDAERRVSVAKALAAAEKEEQELRTTQLLHKLELRKKEELENLNLQAELARKKEAEKLASKQAERDMQVIIDEIDDAVLARKEKDNNLVIEYKKQLADIEKAKQEAYAATVKEIISSIGPDLVAALTAKSNASLLETVSKSMSPYAIASGDESVTDVTNRLLRGTPLEEVITDIAKNKGF